MKVNIAESGGKIVEKSSGGIGFGGMLAILFIALKLCHVIAWSWWWVLSPLWIPMALVLAIFLVFIIVVGIVVLIAACTK